MEPYSLISIFLEIERLGRLVDPAQDQMAISPEAWFPDIKTFPDF